jgi:hypothetical protein
MRLRILACILLFGLTACESKRLLSGPELHSFYEIQVGLTRENVIRLLGEPVDRQTIDDTEFLFYYASWMNTARANEHSPLAIVNGTVVAMGETYYRNFLKSHRRLKETAEHQG